MSCVVGLRGVLFDRSVAISAVICSIDTSPTEAMTVSTRHQITVHMTCGLYEAKFSRRLFKY